jgi:DNA polymerase-1
VTFSAAIAAASESQPQARPERVTGRTLIADGDALAYYCAGNDDTAPGQCRRNLEDKLQAAAGAAGADRIVILATSQASHKGHRFAIATVKPYQGKRDSGRRPKNWAFLRALIECDPRTVLTDTMEADDLFHVNSIRLGDNNVAILTQDKDMRMVPGWHLNWETHALVRVLPDTWCTAVDGKVYGRKWFWLQMLHGDTADNIPGLPKCTIGESQRLCGEVTAAKLLAPFDSEPKARSRVFEQYSAYYGEKDCRAAMLEQACLLWMRRTDRLFDCMQSGGPLDVYAGSQEWAAAVLTVRSRVVDI